MLDSIVSSLLTAKAQASENKSIARTFTSTPTKKTKSYVKADPGHVKTDSGIDVQSQASSSISEGFRRGVINSSRSSLRDDLTATPPNQSPSVSMFRNHNTLKKPRRMSSWSSSESAFSTFRASRDASPSPISITTTWTASISEADNNDMKPSVEIYAEPPLSRSSSQRLITSPSQSPTPEARKRSSTQNTLKISRRRYRSNPNLQSEEITDGATALEESPSVPFPELRIGDTTDTESILSRRSLDSNLIRSSFDASSPVEQRGGQIPRRLSQLGMGRAKLRKLNSSVDLGRPPAINVRATYQVAESPESGSIVESEADERKERRYVILPVRPSMETSSLKSPSLFGAFPRLSSSSDRRDKEDDTHSGRNSGSKKSWMSNVVGKIKGAKK
jgi:hypothetical protein